MIVKLKQGDCLEVLRKAPGDYADSLVADPPAGISFMGKDWDDDKGGRDQWIAWLTEVMKEAMRVLKPGAHGLVWALPRTSHWTAMALENAGFEIRDVVNHLFGTGFPKSLDVSKAIDKAAGAERPVIGKLLAPASTNRVQPFGRPDHSGSGWQDEPNLTAPATDEAKQWQGWGTALKPACEHWILVRKPLGEKTVAANVLRHGTGALNIEGCRISLAAGERPSGSGNASKGSVEGWGNGGKGSTTPATGRFPANLILSHSDECADDACADGCAVAALDGQSGISKSAGGRIGNKDGGIAVPGGRFEKGDPGFGDVGGASRFFYVAKASKRDKGEDNTHPTVKNTELMAYLIKLITPPSGVVLDCFMGSGSTGVAAVRSGFSFVGIEKEEEYFKIAEARIEREKTNGKT